MKLKSSISSGRPIQRGGHPWRQPEDRVATLGWMSMAAVVVAALAAACGAL